MATSRCALLLAALCCVALAGCPKVTQVRGTAIPLVETGAGVQEGPPLAPGAALGDGAVVRVAPGGSITVRYSGTCTRTYGPGTHTLVPCDEEQDEDQDFDRDDFEDEGDERRDADESQDTRDASDAGDAADAAQANATQPTGPLDAVAQFVGSTTGGIVTGVVAAGVLYEHIEDNRDDDREPLSP